MSSACAWRATADPDNLRVMGIYANYLVGQVAGMSDALSLPAVIAALDLLNIDRPARPDLARRLVLLHGLVRDEKKAMEPARG
jgi:hypothetical protein